jgi:hypothetical protein
LRRKGSLGDVVEPIVFVCPANGFAGDDLATMRDPENLLPPTVASMPDLSNATPQSSRMALGRSLLGIGAKDHLTYTLQVNAIRLADLAIAEYMAGYNAVDSYHAETEKFPFSLVLRASGHFETCIKDSRHYFDMLAFLQQLGVIPR